MTDMLTIKPSLMPHHKYRTPFITYEARHDLTDMSRIIRVALAIVPLPCGGEAATELDAFNDLMDRAFSNQWWGHSNGGPNIYVRTTHRDHPGKMFTVARLLAGGERCTRTRYRDHDTFNLRRDNLKVREGYSKGHEADAMTAPAGLDGDTF